MCVVCSHTVAGVRALGSHRTLGVVHLEALGSFILRECRIVETVPPPMSPIKFTEVLLPQPLEGHRHKSTPKDPFIGKKIHVVSFD